MSEWWATMHMLLSLIRYWSMCQEIRGIGQCHELGEQQQRGDRHTRQRGREEEAGEGECRGRTRDPSDKSHLLNSVEIIRFLSPEPMGVSANTVLVAISLNFLQLLLCLVNITLCVPDIFVAPYPTERRLVGKSASGLLQVANPPQSLQCKPCLLGFVCDSC